MFVIPRMSLGRGLIYLAAAVVPEVLAAAVAASEAIVAESADALTVG